MIDFPFRAPLKNLNNRYGIEILMTLFFLFILVYVMRALWKHRFSLLPLALIPLALLIASLGPGVLAYHRDYLKGLSPLLIILPLLMESSLSRPSPRLRKVFLVFMCLQPILFLAMRYRELKYHLPCTPLSLPSDASPHS